MRRFRSFYAAKCVIAGLASDVKIKQRLSSMRRREANRKACSKEEDNVFKGVTVFLIMTKYSMYYVSMFARDRERSFSCRGIVIIMPMSYQTFFFVGLGKRKKRSIAVLCCAILKLMRRAMLCYAMLCNSMAGKTLRRSK